MLSKLFGESRQDKLEFIVLLLARKIYGIKTNKEQSIVEFLDGKIDRDELLRRLSA